MLVSEHHDYTFADLLQAPASTLFGEAAADLREAIMSDNGGDRDSGYVSARRAADLFHQAQSAGGEMRAREEAVYALSRSFRTPECLEQSATLLRSLPAGRYPWARIQTLLARSTCLERMGEVSSSRALEGEARRLAESAGFHTLLLRVMGLTAASDSMLGDFAAARQQDHAGLEYFWSGTFPPLRAYQFYADQANIAEQEGHWNSAYDMEVEAVPMIEMAGNRATEAMALYRAAMYAGMLGRLEESARQMRVADDMLNAAGGRSAAPALRAENVVLMADFYLQNHQDALAAKVLDTVGEDALQGSFRLQLAVHAAKGEAALRQKRFNDGRQEFLKTYAVAEAALDSVRDPRDRALWETQVGPSYRRLVRMILDGENDPLLALAIWEKYRSSPASAGASTRRESGAEKGQLSAFLRHFAGQLHHTSVLTFVQLDDEVAGWVFDDRGIFPYRSPFSAAAAATVCKAFREASSRPDSNLEQLRRDAQHIYQSLIGPAEHLLQEGRTLAVEPDGPCAGIPYEALVDPKGSYLIDRFAVETAPGAFAAAEWPRAKQTINSGLHAVIVGDPRISGELGGVYPELGEARKEASSVGEIFPSHVLLSGANATLLAVERSLPQAQIFHFAGHGVATSQNGVLLLAAPDSGSGAAALDATAMEQAAGHLHLAVLSACYSGVGEKLGPFNPDSLIQALWRAAVPNIMATRWAVDSGVAERVTEGFYRRLLNGDPPAVALRSSVLALRAAPGFAHPAWWAAFHVFGSPLPAPEENHP